MYIFNEYCKFYYHCIAKTCTTDADCANGEFCNDHDIQYGTPSICTGKITLCFYSKRKKMKLNNYRYHFYTFLQILIIPLSLGLVSFGGWCRYGSDDRDQMTNSNVINAQECQQHCVDKRECVAFSYESNNAESCQLYKGGPYTYGSGRMNTTCYIMQGKYDYFCYIV